MHSLATDLQAAQRTDSGDLQACLEAQWQSFLQSETETHEERKQHLLSLKRMITENREAIIDAISLDYGNRSRHETLFAEIISSNDGIIDAIKHLKR